MSGEAGASVSQTIHIEKGEQVYPCRCGVTHRGPYALYDYAHHECFHDAPLIRIDGPEHLMCPSCGETFHVQAHSRGQ